MVQNLTYEVCILKNVNISLCYHVLISFLLDKINFFVKSF